MKPLVCSQDWKQREQFETIILALEKLDPHLEPTNTTEYSAFA